ncbi:MAG: ATP-binding protein, partial [Bacteroidota bacterium]
IIVLQKRMGSIISVINRFIPNHLKRSPHLHRKAAILTYIHLFIFFIILLNGVSCWLYFPENNVSLAFAGCLLGILFWVFQRWGNLHLSGNLLALGLAAVLIPSVFVSGGYFSDNFLWLILAPMLAFLFGTSNSGKIWSFALLGFAIALWALEQYGGLAFKDQYLQFDGNYFFISYFFLIIAILGIISIFKRGQEDIIKLLLRQQKILENQKKEITEQKENLIKKEEELRASNKELEQFAYAASHDLKEPLRAIKIYTQILEKELQAHLNENSREYMGFVTGGVERMQKLLDDLLNYSRLGKGQYRQREVDLNDVLFLVINNLMGRMTETQTAVCSNPLPIIYASSTEMTQLFQNLISNAIKFRKEETIPRIQIRTEEQEAAYLFQVSDNGIGIAKENQQKVFALFERIHSNTEYEGTGIGLATCEKIVKKLGGKIWLESELGKGTTFYFSIPKLQMIQQTLN